MTDQVTSTLATGLPSASVAFTTSESASAELTGPVWSSPRTPTRMLPVPATAVAWKVTSSGVVDPPRAVCTRRSWSPTAVPRVHAAAASPVAFVLTVAGATAPPPLSMTNVTS